MQHKLTSLREDTAFGRQASSVWTVVDSCFDPTKASSAETVFALSNGYRCLRGTHLFAESSLPGNFFAGLFDCSDSAIPELVNCPDPTPLRVFIDYERVSAGNEGSVMFERTYDLSRGCSKAVMTWKAATGAEALIESERFVSLADRHRWCETITIIPGNFSRRILVAAGIDGDALANRGHPMEERRHLSLASAGFFSGKENDCASGLYLSARTIDRKIGVCEARALYCASGSQIEKQRRGPDLVESVWSLEVQEGVPLVFHIAGYSVTTRDIDYAGSDTDEALVRTAFEGLQSFVREGPEAERAKHETAVRELWDAIDIEIDGDQRAQRGLRYNLWQLATCAPPPGDERASIGAKGLHGEGYKGHVFWDTETFMLPFFIHTQSETAKRLLMYRYRNLVAARRNATSTGCCGARFPWESADTGEETTPLWGVNYAGERVRIWTGEIEAHIAADIGFAVLQYWQATGDNEFMRNFGLQMLLEICAFWAGFAKFEKESGQYEIRDVIGPDEFHEHVDNNVYTNYLVKWILIRTVEAASKELASDPASVAATLRAAGLELECLKEFSRVAGLLKVPAGKDTLLIEQFDGYFDLDDPEITRWDENGMPLWPDSLDLGRIDRTQLIKQPDVVMLFALLGSEFDREVKCANYDYYEKRTMHKSSLSPSMYAMVGLPLGRNAHAYEYFIKAVETDLVDNQRNTALGIHSASMGGVWQTAVFGFGGLSFDSCGIPAFEPWLPPQWKSLKYRIVHRGNPVQIEVEAGKITIYPESAFACRVGENQVQCPPGRPTAVLF